VIRVLSLVLALFLSVSSPLAAAKGKISQKGNFGIAGWLVYWDPKAMQVYEQNAAIIDRVYPEWYTIGVDGLPRSN
jgi:hypothetical protein